MKGHRGSGGIVQSVESSEHRNSRPLPRLRSIFRQSTYSRRSTAPAICFKIRFLSRFHTKLPVQVRAVLAALRFSSPDRSGISEFSEEDWKKALHFCDSTHLTLALGLRCREDLPDWVRSRIDGNLTASSEHWQQGKSASI